MGGEVDLIRFVIFIKAYSGREMLRSNPLIIGLRNC